MGEGEGGMIWESGIETCIISYMERVASPGSMHDMDAWGWCTGTTQRDGMGREEGSGWGTRVYLWQIHIDIWQNQYNIVKLKKKYEQAILSSQVLILNTWGRFHFLIISKGW